jgi:hypothetical protein
VSGFFKPGVLWEHSSGGVDRSIGRSVGRPSPRRRDPQRICPACVAGSGGDNPYYGGQRSGPVQRDERSLGGQSSVDSRQRLVLSASPALRVGVGPARSSAYSANCNRSNSAAIPSPDAAKIANGATIAVISPRINVNEFALEHAAGTDRKTRPFAERKATMKGRPLSPFAPRKCALLSVMLQCDLSRGDDNERAMITVPGFRRWAEPTLLFG